MYVKTNLVYGYLLAKKITKIYKRTGIAGRDLKGVHRIYGRAICNVGYDTFCKYVNMPDEELGGTELPAFVAPALQMLGFFRDCELYGIPLPKSDKLTPEQLDDYLERTIARRREERKKQEERKGNDRKRKKSR